MLSTYTDKTTESSLAFTGDFFRSSIKKVDLAIFSAMPEELEYLQKCFSKSKCETVRAGDFEFKVYEYKSRKILLAQTGLGTTFAASILTLIHQSFRPNYIFITGTAGGIKNTLNLRDVVIVKKAFEAEIQGAFTILKGTPFESCLTHPLKNQSFPAHYSANEELLNISASVDFTDIKIHRGIMVSSNSFPAPKELFEKIKSENPDAIDMETSAFYQVAWLLKLPVLAIRGISNILNHDGTDDKVHESDVSGSAEAAARVLLTIIDTLLLKLNIKKMEEEKMKSHVDTEVKNLVNSLSLQPHPEGGHYARSYQSTMEVKSSDKDHYDNEFRKAGTAIYYLLKGHDFSAWHSLKSDEIWHHYKGSAVKIYVINNDGELRTYLLGDPTAYPDALFQVAITAGHWFAAEITDKDSYCLVGCTVNPGFEFKDFKLADRKYLSELFPRHTAIINQFTRIVNSELKDNNSSYAAQPGKRLLSRL